MTTALFALPGILAPLQGLFRWFAAGTLPSRCAVPPTGLRKSDIAGQAKACKPNTDKSNIPKLIATYAIPTRAGGINGSQIGAGTAFRAQSAKSAVPRSPVSPLSQRSPISPCSTRSPRAPVVPALRVMRVLEAGQAPACVGRMVISGRMADVCAELDRLAAREAALR